MNAFENWLSGMASHIKLVDQALTGMEGSYVELLTVLSLGLLAVLPVVIPARHRQLSRWACQVAGILIFVFIVYTCLGVFGMINNFFRGLGEIGHENIIALYFLSVPATILITSMIFGPTFCGWVCPTGAVQEFVGSLAGKWHAARRRAGYPFSWKYLGLSLGIAAVFFAWIGHLSATRIFFVEDATVYWTEILVMILLVLAWGMKPWDARLRRLRVVSFWVITLAAYAGMRVTSPVHFGFSKVYDPASILATAIVVAASLAIPRVWCRYLCPWREAIAWVGKFSTCRLETDPAKCSACGGCDDVCSVEAVSQGVIDTRECHFCLKCVDACPHGAIQIKEKW